MIATADPAQLYGAGLRWPDAEVRPPARRAGAYLVTVGGRPVLSRARGRALAAPCSAGRTTSSRRSRRSPPPSAPGACAGSSLDTIDGEPAVASPLAERLVALGFRRGLHDFSLAPGDA